MRKQMPILFSTAMVQAILAGRKSMTRRQINPQPRSFPTIAAWKHYESHCPDDWTEDQHIKTFMADKSPYGEPGGILYVREEYYQLGHWEIDPIRKTKGGRVKWKFVPDSSEISFEAPDYFRKGRHHKDPYTHAIHKRLGRFMPRNYARIWLEVASNHVERVKSISFADAQDEGVEPMIVDQEDRYKNYMWRDDPAYIEFKSPTFANPIDSFRTLWQSINGPDSWKANPWVWVVSFRILSTTGKPAGLEKEETNEHGK